MARFLLEEFDLIFYYPKSEIKIKWFTGLVLEGVWSGFCRLFSCFLVLSINIRNLGHSTRFFPYLDVSWKTP